MTLEELSTRLSKKEWRRLKRQILLMRVKSFFLDLEWVNKEKILHQFDRYYLLEGRYYQNRLKDVWKAFYENWMAKG